MADLAQVLQFMVNGVVLGSILALGAIGLTLVYGILNLSNFAHGDLLSFGAFAALFFGVTAYPGNGVLLPAGFVAAAILVGLPLADRFTTRRLARGERNLLLAAGAVVALAALWIALAGPGGRGTTDRVLLLATLLAILATVAVAVFGEFAVWRPLRRRRATLLTFVIVSIGASLVIRNLLLNYFGGATRAFQRPNVVADRFGDVLVSESQQFALLMAVLLILGVHLFLKKTRTGKAMRAMADNLDLARVSGIDVDRVIVYVWAIAGALVAVAGVLLALVQNNEMHANMGFFLILPLFASVILGGIGSAYGAMLGALVVGVAMKTSALWLGTQYELAAAFVILIVVLLTRPQGLLGVRA